MFCEATEAGFGVCIYTVAQDDEGERKAVFLSVKAKNAPLKAQSILRLELCATLLGSNLIKAVSESLKRMDLKIKHQYE